MHMLREKAQQRKISVDQLILQTIKFLLDEKPNFRLQAAEALFHIEAPVADWETMKQEIAKAHMQE